MTNALIISGSRPSSAAGARPRSGYRKLGNTSEVDESLFGFRNLTDIKDGYHAGSFGVQTPKEKKRGPPLLWAPSSVDKKPDKIHRVEKLTLGNNKSQKYRPTTQTPTYVDESLFGKKLEEPSFQAPWAEKKKAPRPFLWSPPEFSNKRQMTQTQKDSVIEPFSVDGRPPSRQGRRPASTRTRPSTVESVTSGKSHWKP